MLIPSCGHKRGLARHLSSRRELVPRPSARAVKSLLMPRSWSWLHSALDTRVDCIERRRAADVQSVSLLAAEAQIGHRLGYVDLADQIAGRGIAANAVLVRIAPADGAPNAAVPVGAQSISNARLRHFRKDLAVRQFAILDIRVEHADMRRVVRTVGESSTDDVELLLV